MDQYIINTDGFQITQLEFLIRFLISTGIGFLIGFEREHHALAKGQEAFAGIRTFILLSLLGFVGASLHYLLHPWILIVAVIGVILLTGISYWITANRGDIGGTSEITGIIAVLLGVLTFLGHLEISLMMTVLIVVLLSLKLQMQEVVGSVTREELYDFIRFVVIALMIFPFLPDETYGPYDVINPKEVGWVIILTSGLGLVGYILMRIFGAHKGTLITGVIGGLVSSTAVTWIFAKKSRENPDLSMHCVTAILAASSIMVIRVGIWVTVFNRQLLQNVALSLGIVFAAAIGITLYYYIKSRDQKSVDSDLPHGKPLNLTGALIFGALYTIILLVVAYANDTFGNKGIFLASGVAGVSDVDAITISVSKLSLGSISAVTAGNAILIATISNTLVKMGIAIWAGSKKMRRKLYLGYGAIFVAAILGFILMNL
jgi:uncharacterized membrane protein (DUF4010 family)